MKNSNPNPNNQPKKRGGKPKHIRKMKPGADQSLKNVFSKIGVPKAKTFRPDRFQLEAIEAVEEFDCLVAAPTGSGKTWIAEKVTEKTVNKGGRVWYATPLKALTNSIYNQFRSLFGNDQVGILTGDIKENSDASIIIGTTEILRNQLYDAMYTGENLGCDLIILDEAHYLGDDERGVVWEEILIYLPSRVPLLLLSATIGNPHQISQWLELIRGRTCRVIEASKRPVPLFPIFFHPTGTLLPLLKRGKAKLHPKVISHLEEKHKPKMAPPGKLPRFNEVLKVMKKFNLLPVIFFLKSRADCDQAIKLCTGEILSRDPERKEKLRKRIAELVEGNPHLARHHQREILENTAAASHHSGHLPAWKVVIETLMAEGLLDAMFATSTVAAGVNFPARSVCILNSDRFNGTEFVPLTASEFQQMTGRAGRRGMDNIGFGIVLPGKFMDLRYVAKLVNAPPIDIRSQIKIDFSMVLNLLLSHSPDQIRMLLDKSFASYMLTQKGKYAKKQFGADLKFLWHDFLAHMEFLKEENFVTEDGRLTADGMWASSLRIDTPLIVAESLRQGLFQNYTPPILAGVMAAFVNEKEFREEEFSERDMATQMLTSHFVHMRKTLKPFADKLIKREFHVPSLYIEPAAVIFSWAKGEPWESITARTDMAEGDLARLILRTAENLRQMAGLRETFPETAQNAEEACQMILREPVFTFYK